MNIRILACLFLCLTVAGCGWHLRGSTAGGTSHITALKLVTESPYSRLSRSLDRQMKQEHIDQTAPNGWNLHILKEKTSGNTLAFSDSTYPATQEMVLEVRFSVSNPAGEEVIAPNTERVVRVLESDGDYRLAGDREQELMRDEMYDEMAANLLRRINFIAEQGQPVQ